MLIINHLLFYHKTERIPNNDSYFCIVFVFNDFSFILHRGQYEETDSMYVNPEMEVARLTKHTGTNVALVDYKSV